MEYLGIEVFLFFGNPSFMGRVKLKFQTPVLLEDFCQTIVTSFFFIFAILLVLLNKVAFCTQHMIFPAILSSY